MSTELYMWTDIIIMILGAIFLIAGLIGCVLPIIPGPPVAYVALLLLYFSDHPLGAVSMIMVTLVTVAVTIVDFVFPTWVTKKMGGSKWAIWGTIIGLLVGVLFLGPIGVILCPFMGAIIGELLGGKKSIHALRAGFGSFLGFVFGTLLKTVCVGWISWLFIGSF